MKLKIIGVGSFTQNDLSQFTEPPQWRKATRNMIIATASVQCALREPQPQWLTEASERVALIVGTNSGELDTTTEFLATFVKMGMARPVLFQNSLHNATAGFTSIQLKVRGPSFTLSSGSNTAAECVTLAENLMADGIVDICIVICVEGHQRVAEMLGFGLGLNDESLRDGACALVLATTDACVRWGLSDAPDLDRAQACQAYPPPQIAPFYQIEKLGMFRLVQSLEAIK